jgi:hypothetical protein
VVELEKVTRLSIPTASLRQENFASLEAVAKMLEELKE